MTETGKRIFYFMLGTLVLVLAVAGLVIGVTLAFELAISFIEWRAPNLALLGAPAGAKVMRAGLICWLVLMVTFLPNVVKWLRASRSPEGQSGLM